MRVKENSSDDVHKESVWAFRSAVLEGKVPSVDRLKIAKATLKFTDLPYLTGETRLDMSWQVDLRDDSATIKYMSGKRRLYFDFHRDRWPIVKVTMEGDGRTEEIEWHALPRFFDKYMEWRPRVKYF